MEGIKLYTVEEVEAILKVTKRSLYSYISSGKLKAVKIGREWRVTEENLKAFIHTGTKA